MTSIIVLAKSFLKTIKKLPVFIYFLCFIPVIILVSISFNETVRFNSIATLAPQDLDTEFYEFKQYSVGSLEYLEQSTVNLTFRSFLVSIKSKKFARQVLKDPIYELIIQDRLFNEITKKSTFNNPFISQDELKVINLNEYLKKTINIDSSDRWSLDAKIKFTSDNRHRGNIILSRLIGLADESLKNEYVSFFEERNIEKESYLDQISSLLVANAIYTNIDDNVWRVKKYQATNPFAFKFTEIIENPLRHNQPRIFSDLFLALIFFVTSIFASTFFFMIRKELNH